MPEKVGPYSPFVEAGDLVFISGQVGIENGALVEGGLENELKQALANLSSVLHAAEITKEQIVKTTVFMTDMDNYARINEIYLSYFDGRKPARSAVAVKDLPLGAIVEIEAIAHK